MWTSKFGNCRAKARICFEQRGRLIPHGEALSPVLATDQSPLLSFRVRWSSAYHLDDGTLFTVEVDTGHSVPFDASVACERGALDRVLAALGRRGSEGDLARLLSQQWQATLERLHRKSELHTEGT